MNDRVVRVTAPSRLHFGMLSFGQSHGRHFGGAGVMIDSPGLQIELRHAASNRAEGPMAERALAVLNRLSAGSGRGKCHVQVLAAPPEHVGLGVGTQLSLALCAGLRALWDEPPLLPVELARWSARGRRSAVGVYGFCLGGMIVESGKLADEPLSPLVARLDVPEQWRFVLAVPLAERGLSGIDEERAFADLPPVPQATTAELCRELMTGLVPAVASADFELAGESLYRFGCAAGACFASRQGGPFNGPAVAALVARIRSLGIHGVGQSSWGPTVFALMDSDQAAASLVSQLNREATDWRLIIARPQNFPAIVNALD